MSRREVLRQQRKWAKARGLPVDTRGYCERYELNLRRPLSTAARAGFERGGGAELFELPHRPARMRALHSSAVLVANVFDHWSPAGMAPMLRALGLDAQCVDGPQFEVRFSTGLHGEPPNLDVALKLDSGTVVGIESKFTEWLERSRPGRPPFKAKYFEGNAAPWASAGLARCQALVADLVSGAEPFRFLDAPQLLKHALGLATQHPGGFMLCYVYYEIACPTAAVHERELARFANRVGPEIGFNAVSYQQLFRSLKGDETVDAEYLAYLERRYFASAG